jgi:hypothetical protein
MRKKKRRRRRRKKLPQMLSQVPTNGNKAGPVRVYVSSSPFEFICFL